MWGPGGDPRWRKLTVELLVHRPGATAEVREWMKTAEGINAHPEWFQRIAIELDPSALSYQTDSTLSPPLARAAGRNITAEIGWVQARPQDQIAASLWIKIPGAMRPPSGAPSGLAGGSELRWHLKAPLPTPAKRGATVVARAPEPVEARALYWKADGSPVREGEQGIELKLSRPAKPTGAAAPQTVSLSLELEASRVARHTFEVEGIPVPAKPGDLMPLKTIAIGRSVPAGATGAQVILWKVGRFDLKHQVPFGPYDPSGEPIRQSGIVPIFEFRPAPQQVVARGLAGVTAKTYGVFGSLSATDDRGRQVDEPPGLTSYWNSTGFGDDWRDYKKKPDGTPIGRDATFATWYSFYRSLPQAGAKSLTARMQVEEKTVFSPTEKVVLKDIPLPPG